MKRSVCMLLMASVLVLGGCRKKDPARVKNPIRVKTEAVGATGAISGHTYVGIVEENEGTAVSFTGMGVVSRVYVKEGQAVRRGQLIAEMDDTQARNLLSASEAQMAQADDALQRYGMLHENGSLPEVQWVEIQSKVAQAQSSLAAARKSVADCRLVAPVSGIIGRKSVNAGETAVPSEAVVTILDINTVNVKVSVPENEMSGIGSHTGSTIKVAAANKTVPGGYIEKGMQADALTHTYDLRIKVPNGDHRLLPGMVADVTLHTGGSYEDRGRFTLPVTSVQKKSDGTLFVWTVGTDSTAHRTPVEVGHTIGNRIVLTGGVEEGLLVVTEGYQKLSEGTRVVF